MNGRTRTAGKTPAARQARSMANHFDAGGTVLPPVRLDAEATAALERLVGRFKTKRAIVQEAIKLLDRSLGAPAALLTKRKP